MKNNRIQLHNSKIMTTSSDIISEETYWAHHAKQLQLEKAKIACEEQIAWKEHETHRKIAEAECIERTQQEIEEFFNTEAEIDELINTSQNKAASRRKKAAHHKKMLHKKADSIELNHKSRLNDDLKNGLAKVEKEMDKNGNIVKKVHSIPGSRTAKAKMLQKKAYPGNTKPNKASN